MESIIPNVEGIKNTAQANKYQLILGKILGKGNFGIVYYGKLMSNNKKIVDVAVKTLQGKFMMSCFSLFFILIFGQ